MTPYGKKVRELRERKDIMQKDMATALNVSGAYLSALEHGSRGTPKKDFVSRVAVYLGLDQDQEAELQALASVSDPKAKIVTDHLSPKATQFANWLAENIGQVSDETIDAMHTLAKQDRQMLARQALQRDLR